MPITSTERLKAKNLQLIMSRRRQVRGRADGDWSASHRTRLYAKHSAEYCELLEVLELYYSDHVLPEAG